MIGRFAMSPEFSGALHSAYNPGELVGAGQKGRSMQSQMAATADADVANAIRMGEAKVEGAKHIGAGTVAQGQAAGHSSMMGGISSGLGSIVGGLGSMGGGGSGSGFTDLDIGKGLPTDPFGTGLGSFSQIGGGGLGSIYR
jgi:hypothetical protein